MPVCDLRCEVQRFQSRGATGQVLGKSQSPIDSGEHDQTIGLYPSDFGRSAAVATFSVRRDADGGGEVSVCLSCIPILINVYVCESERAWYSLRV